MSHYQVTSSNKMIAPTADPTAVVSAVPTEHLFSNSDEKSEDTYQVQYTVHPGRLAWTCDCPADTCRKRCCHIDQCIDLFRAGLAGGTVAHPFNVQPPKAA